MVWIASFMSAAKDKLLVNGSAIFVRDGGDQNVGFWYGQERTYKGSCRVPVRFELNQGHPAVLGVAEIYIDTSWGGHHQILVPLDLIQSDARHGLRVSGRHRIDKKHSILCEGTTESYEKGTRLWTFVLDTIHFE